MSDPIVKRKASSLKLDLPPTEKKAWQILEEKSWAPIAFAKRKDGFGLKEVPLMEATVLSAYAALCMVYPHVEIRGALICRLKKQINGQTLSEWEKEPGRTQLEVIELLKIVEGR